MTSAARAVRTEMIAVNVPGHGLTVHRAAKKPKAVQRDSAATVPAHLAEKAARPDTPAISVALNSGNRPCSCRK